MKLTGSVATIVIPMLAKNYAAARLAIVDAVNQAVDFRYDIVVSVLDRGVAEFLTKWLRFEINKPNVKVVVPQSTAREDMLLTAGQMVGCGSHLAIWDSNGRYSKDWLTTMLNAVEARGMISDAVYVPASVGVYFPGDGIIYCGEETAIPQMVESTPSAPARPATYSMETASDLFAPMPCLLHRWAAPFWGAPAGTSISSIVGQILTGTLPGIPHVLSVPGPARTVLTGDDSSVDRLRSLARRRASSVLPEGAVDALPGAYAVTPVSVIKDHEFFKVCDLPVSLNRASFFLPSEGSL